VVDIETHSEPSVSVGELARYWHVSTRTIYRDIFKGALPAFRLPGGTMRVKTTDARTYGRPIE
jgi:excisionase family DNA binding protein